ncbi:MAG: hypothetical protein R3E79_01170 [Caldilineaceae bacterium]
MTVTGRPSVVLIVEGSYYLAVGRERWEAGLCTRMRSPTDALPALRIPVYAMSCQFVNQFAGNLQTIDRQTN